MSDSVYVEFYTSLESLERWDAPIDGSGKWSRNIQEVWLAVRYMSLWRSGGTDLFRTCRLLSLSEEEEELIGPHTPIPPKVLELAEARTLTVPRLRSLMNDEVKATTEEKVVSALELLEIYDGRAS